MKISSKDIAEAVYGATKDKSGQDLAVAIRRSVQMIGDRRMLSKSDEILNTLQNIFDKKAGTVKIKVTTAKNMEPEERNKLENEIKERYNAKIVTSEFFKKEELLGGMRVETGDEIFDNTYRRKLCELEKFLMREK